MGSKNHQQRTNMPTPASNVPISVAPIQNPTLIPATQPRRPVGLGSNEIEHFDEIAFVELSIMIRTELVTRILGGNEILIQKKTYRLAGQEQHIFEPITSVMSTFPCDGKALCEAGYPTDFYVRQYQDQIGNDTLRQVTEVRRQMEQFLSRNPTMIATPATTTEETPNRIPVGAS